MSLIEDYLRPIDPKRKEILQHIAEVVMQTVPDAVEGKSYGMPAFKYNGRPLLGFIAAKDHMSLFPFSPSVIEKLKNDLREFDVSKGTIRFTEANVPTDDLLKKIIHERRSELV